MRDRAVRTRREPGGGKRRAQHGLYGFLRITAFSRVLRPSSGENCRLVASRAEEKGARNTAFKVFHESRDTNHETRLLCFSRITRHETRITAFSRVLRPSGGEKYRLGACLTERKSPIFCQHLVFVIKSDHNWLGPKFSVGQAPSVDGQTSTIIRRHPRRRLVPAPAGADAVCHFLA